MSQSQGWNYEVRCEPDAILYANVKFLAAYGRDWQFDPEVLGALRAAAADGPTPCLKAIVDDVDLPESTAIARLMHLL